MKLDRIALRIAEMTFLPFGVRAKHYERGSVDKEVLTHTVIPGGSIGIHFASAL
jgi:hypothetical protein